MLALGCAPAAEVPDVEPAGVVPAIRVALAAGARAVTLGGGDALRVEDPAGVPLAEVGAGATAEVRPRGEGMQLQWGGAVPAAGLRVVPAAPGGIVRVNGTDVRGTVTIQAGREGLLAVNQLPVEAYLAGVVTAEMGRRAPGEAAALEAQAIVSRTFALRSIGRWRAREYDVLATVADQAYGGVRAETAQGLEAVRRTSGLILTFEGQPIEAFFHSTCGGRTAAGEEVFAAGGRAYLRSVSDVAPDGTSWCAISPRYRWSESWTGAALGAAVRAALPEAATGGELRDLVVMSRTPSGRVQTLGVVLASATVPVTGAAVRRVLQPGPGQLLRSAAFELQITREGSRLVRVAAAGQGAGHGVGLCQWGAVGRARAGFSAAQILAAYYAGARLERRW